MIFAANCRTDAGAELETPADVITHLASTEGSIVHAEVGSTSATVFVDAVDYVTGLSVREAWTFVISDGAVSQIVGCCGGRLIQERQKLAHREVDAYLRGYDLHFVTAAEEPVVALARDVLSTWLGRPVSSDTRDALVNEDLIYIPETWVGCGGFLYDRRAERIILLGSGIPVAVHVWAFYRGFADGETGADRLNDLVITSVRDEAATYRTLRTRLLNPPKLDSLPVRIESIDLYFFREELWKAELRGFFRFDVLPPSGSA